MSVSGERARLAHDIARAKALLDALELTLAHDVPCTEAAQAVAYSAVCLVSTAARCDAYAQAAMLVSSDNYACKSMSQARLCDELSKMLRGREKP